jgi:uncharacterized membrane protein YfcA
VSGILYSSNRLRYAAAMSILAIAIVVISVFAVNYLAARLICEKPPKVWEVVVALFLGRSAERLARLLFGLATQSNPQPMPLYLTVSASSLVMFLFYLLRVKTDLKRALLLTAIYILTAVIAIVAILHLLPPSPTGKP